MAPLENLYCLRCNRELEAGHKSVAVYMFAQTVGIRPRQKSAAQRICFCPQCSVSLAMGPPPEGALNLAAWNMIRDLVCSDPALNQAAWENLRGLAGLLPATGTDGPFATIDRGGVGKLMEIARDQGRKTRPDIKLGICGEHGGDPESVKYCHALGLDYVSCSPFRLPIARLAAAQAAIAKKA